MTSPNLYSFLGVVAAAWAAVAAWKQTLLLSNDRMTPYYIAKRSMMTEDYRSISRAGQRLFRSFRHALYVVPVDMEKASEIVKLDPAGLMLVNDSVRFMVDEYENAVSDILTSNMNWSDGTREHIRAMLIASSSAMECYFVLGPTTRRYQTRDYWLEVRNAAGKACPETRATVREYEAALGMTIEGMQADLVAIDLALSKKASSQ